MKRIILFAAIASCVAWGPISLGGGTGGCERHWTLNTSTDSIGSEWIEAGPDVHASCPWVIADSLITWESNAASTCDNGFFIGMRNLNVGGTEQWMCAKMTGRNGSVTFALIFRADSSTESTEWTQVKILDGADTVGWGETGGGSFGTCVIDANYALGENFCAHIYGTGASTTVDIWVDPVGSLPEDWGDPECTMTETAANDTGGYQGLGTPTTSGTDLNSELDWSEAYGGSCG